MIQDYEQELTTAGGQLFTVASGAGMYGTKPYDLKGTGQAIDPSVGEPISAFLRVVDADSDVETSAAVSIVADDDGAGTNEVVLCTKTILKAALTANTVHKIGTLARGLMTATNRYLSAKVLQNYTTTAPTVGKFRLFLVKATDCSPFNSGVKL